MKFIHPVFRYSQGHHHMSVFICVALNSMHDTNNQPKANRSHYRAYGVNTVVHSTTFTVSHPNIRTHGHIEFIASVL